MKIPMSKNQNQTTKTVETENVKPNLNLIMEMIAILILTSLKKFHPICENDSDQK